MTAMAVPWLRPGTPRLAPRCIFQEVKREEALVCRQHMLYNNSEMVRRSSCSVDHIKAALPGDTSQHGKRVVVGGFLPSGRWWV